MSYLDAIEKQTGDQPDASVIWLHGLGASGHDFEPVIPELQLPADAAVRFIFPHAPTLPVTINGGMRMPAWYDIKALELDRSIDEAQLMASADEISKLIKREIERGVDSRRIIVAGFSQGGAVAYQVGLTYSEPLGGLLAMSTYFATEKTLVPSEANRSIPIRIYHGLHDPMVPETLGRKSLMALQNLNYAADYITYPMEHSVCLEEIQDIGVFIRTNLKLD